jgi:plastocyanin
MRATARVAAVILALVVGYWAAGALNALAQVRNQDNRISVMDNCLPGDAAWNPTGGCAQDPQHGDVSNAEFGALLTSPLTIPPRGALIGHPSWRNEPSHITAAEGRTIKVKNEGGRGHTFTEVAEFGGGFVGVLNIGLTQAPQCTPASTVPLPPGATEEITGLAPGLHKFQCCIHPWMRATIRVE